MADKRTEKGILSFMEGMMPFRSWGKGRGFRNFLELAVTISLDEENIGYITKEGKVIICGHVIERDPTTIMSYSNTFTSERWDEIGAKKDAFKEKCAKREAEFGPTFKKLEALACSMFPVDRLFRHLEITAIGNEHIVLAGGKGEWSSYPPGVYIYESNETVANIGYRALEEMKVECVNNLGDELLTKLVKAASIMAGTQCSFNADTYSLPCTKNEGEMP